LSFYRVATALCICLAALIPRTASAHPLGNFTINHLARVQVSAGQLHVHYVLDIAEIPTFQIMSQAGDGKWNAADARTWADQEVERVRTGLQMTADGSSVPLQLIGAPTERLRPGAGGLPILYWTAEFGARLSNGAHTIAVVDRTYADRRIGWKDIVVGAQTEPTHELQTYPPALIGTPQRINGASFQVTAAGTIRDVRETADASPLIASSSSWFAPTALSALFTRPDQTPLFVLLTILAAFGLGAAHAIEPGHGKALLAFTLVGARATTRQAAILAASLTFAHTIGVIILGLMLFSFAGFVSETVYPWINLVTGAAIAFLGARALSRYVTSRRVAAHAGTHSHAHHHGDHTHADGTLEHSHGGKMHSHAMPAGGAPLKFSTAVWAAMSGGIAPCPAAIVVLLAALRLHKVGQGVLLIVVFSLGLATVLTALGIGVVHGETWLSRRSAFDRVVKLAPLFSAMVISVIGSVLVGQGIAQQGVAVPAHTIALLMLVAIAGYAMMSFYGRRSAVAQKIITPHLLEQLP